MMASSAPAQVLMQVEGLAKRYGDQRALSGISFAVNAGEVLEVIAGVLAADAGHVLWRGTPLPLPRRHECLFYLPDGIRPWEDQHVARVTEFFAAVYGRPDNIVAETIRS